MNNNYEEAYWLPLSTQYKSTKQLLDRVQKKLTDDNQIKRQKKQVYIRVIKQINYTMGKVVGRWPIQVEKLIDNLRSILIQFDNGLTSLARGSSFFCGSAGNPKALQSPFSRIAAYQHIFSIIRPFQDKQIRNSIIKQQSLVMTPQIIKEKKQNQIKKINEQKVKQKKQQPVFTDNQPCKKCQLFLSVSLCPNGFIAKKLLKQLPDTEWISGILHQQGKILDKDLQKAISFYLKAKQKKNYEAIYRLGSLNERLLFGKPYQYLKMWQQASSNGHLEAATDMGYVYQYGITDDDSGKEIIKPDLQKALKYYTKAAEKNFPRALNNLASFYFNNQNFKDSKLCLKYLHEAAQAQFAKALHNLGLIYHEGDVVTKDQKRALSLIRRSALKGNPQGGVSYIQLVLNEPHNFTDLQLQDANQICRDILAKQPDNIDVYFFMGIMIEEGYGCDKNPNVAYLYYRLAADQGSSKAQTKLGDCYRNGFGVQKDLKQAIRYYEKSRDNNVMAYISLGQIYEQGNKQLGINIQKAYQKAAAYYYQACNKNIPEGYFKLAEMYKFGRGKAKNQQKAEQYLARGQQLMQQNTKKLNASSSDMIQSSYYRRR